MLSLFDCTANCFVFQGYTVCCLPILKWDSPQLKLISTNPTFVHHSSWSNILEWSFLVYCATMMMKQTYQHTRLKHDLLSTMRCSEDMQCVLKWSPLIANMKMICSSAAGHTLSHWLLMNDRWTLLMAHFVRHYDHLLVNQWTGLSDKHSHYNDIDLIIHRLTDAISLLLYCCEYFLFIMSCPSSASTVHKKERNVLSSDKTNLEEKMMIK